MSLKEDRVVQARLASKTFLPDLQRLCLALGIQMSYSVPIDCGTGEPVDVVVVLTLPADDSGLAATPVPDTAASEQPPAECKSVRKIVGCSKDILDVIREAHTPLSQRRVLDLLGKKNLEWSESTVRGALSTMVDLGHLLHFQHPRGYGLAEWGQVFEQATDPHKQQE